MKAHVASVHENKKSSICDICEKRFFDKNRLTRHVESVHEGKKPFQCKICDKKFSAKTSMNRHVASVHEKKKLSSNQKIEKNQDLYR